MNHQAACAGRHGSICTIHPYHQLFTFCVVNQLLQGEPSEVDATLPLCDLYEHNEGSWLLDAARSRKQVPPCCGWDRHKWGGESDGRFMFLDYAEYCGTSPMKTDPALAEIENGLSYSGREDFLVHLGGYGCSCQRFGFEDRYSWVPDNCRLLEWDAHRFCSLLGTRRLLVVGDSTVSQAASVLMNFIHWGFWDVGKVGCQTQVTFANSDTLVGRELGVDNRGGNWTGLVRHFDPDIILISSGPHINRPMPLRNADFASVIKQVAHEHQTHFPDKILIWKTQAPGGCTRSISDRIPGPAFFSSLPYPHYNWQQFEEWDWLARATLTGQPNQYVLDLTPLYYRTDAHPGCHYYEGFRVDEALVRPMTPTSTNPPRETRAEGMRIENEMGEGEEGEEERRQTTRGRAATGSEGESAERRDCLHHCVPGPISLLPQLLLHLFEREGI